MSREARITIEDYTGPVISLSVGVTQGSALSPTLCTIYTADLTQPAAECTIIQYVDDITQIAAYSGKSRKLMANRTIS